MKNVISLRPRRTPPLLTTAEQVTAVFTHRALYEVAAVIPAKDRVGRPRLFPPYLLLGYGVLTRVFRSGARVAQELTDPHLWQVVQQAVATAIDLYDLDIDPPGARPPDWDAYRYARNRYLTDPDILTDMRRVFTQCAVDQARQAGLLDPAGPGSLCHPHPSRTVYGDGTVVRPMYRPPPAKRTTDPATGATTVTYLDAHGQPIPAPVHRFDPDAADYHGHAGSVHGQNFVAWSVRGPGPHQRVVLGVDRVERPGLEADKAVEVGLTHPQAHRLGPVSQLGRDPLDRPVLGPQLGPQGPDHPHRCGSLLGRVPTRGRLPLRHLSWHGSILVSKVRSLQLPQGDSVGVSVVGAMIGNMVAVEDGRADAVRADRRHDSLRACLEEE